MKSIRWLLVPMLLLLMGNVAEAQVLLNEIFNYADGALCDDSAGINTTSPYYPLVANNVSGGLWVNGSTSKNDDPLLVQTGALTYSGYVLSGMGKKVWCPNLTGNTSNNRASRAFPGQTGKTYFAILVNLPTLADLSASTSSGGEYLAGMYSTASFATAAGRGLITFRLSDSTGKYQIGIRATSTAPAGWITSRQCDTATTYLVVVSHDRTSPGTSNIWVNPVLGAVEPTPDATSNIGTADVNADLGKIGIYQRGQKPHAYVGNIRVATNWGAITNVAPFPFTETFDFTEGGLNDNSATLNTTSKYYPLAADNVSGFLWVNGSTSKNDDPLLVQTGALTYTGYALSGLGKKVWCPNMVGNTSNNRASRAFAPQTGKTYYAILVNLPTIADLSSSTSSGGEYLCGLYGSAGFATANGRGLITFRLSATTGKYVIGIRANSTATAGWVAKDLDTNVTQLVVVSYDRTNNGTANVWVNPAISGTEPTPDATSNLGIADVMTDVGRFGIYQRGTKPHAYVGGIFATSTWPLITTDVTEKGFQVPTELRLFSNYPNPFNPSTVIRYQVSVVGEVKLRVFDLLGREVATLVDGVMSAGVYSATFNAKALTSGTYFARLEAEGRTLLSKLSLLK